MQERNDPNRIRLRKYENTLTVSGVAVIAFGLWSIIKSGLYFITGNVDVLSAFETESDVQGLEEIIGTGGAHVVADTIFLGVLFAFLSVDVLIRVYVGRSAVLDGRRVKRGNVLYVILACILIVPLASEFITGFIPQENQAASVSDLDTVLASRLLDATSLAALLEMVFASIQVRHLRKKLGIGLWDSRAQDKQRRKRGKNGKGKLPGSSDATSGTKPSGGEGEV